MTYNRPKMSRIFPYEQRWVWGPIVAFSFAPAVIANTVGASDQTVSAIFFAGAAIAAVVCAIFDPRGRGGSTPSV